MDQHQAPCQQHGDQRRKGEIDIEPRSLAARLCLRSGLPLKQMSAREQATVQDAHDGIQCQQRVMGQEREVDK